MTLFNRLKLVKIQMNYLTWHDISYKRYK